MGVSLVPSTNPAQATQADAGTGTGSPGTNVATDTWGQVSPAKFRKTVVPCGMDAMRTNELARTGRVVVAGMRIHRPGSK